MSRGAIVWVSCLIWCVCPVRIALAETPCDYNNNGLVDQADLDLVLTSWGKPFDEIPPTWSCAMPTEGIVDQEELDVVLTSWGHTGAALAVGGLPASGVPEPATWALLLLCGVLWLPWLCRR